MKQKIVIHVPMDSEKCRSKALKVAAVASGVSSVSLEGADKDQVAVTGERVDSVCLAKELRKKFGHASIVSVEEVKEEKKKEEPESKPITEWPIIYPPCPLPYEVIYDQNPNNCTVM